MQKASQKAPIDAVNPQLLVPAQALRLEREHVHDVYDSIADHFSHTRYKGWPKVVEFVQEQTAKTCSAVLVDVGCGNGKYWKSVHENAHWIGVDYCLNLLATVKGKDPSRMPQVCRDDITNLAMRSNVADAAICIAVLHHISTPERRILAVAELVRITKPGGLILIYTMAQQQKPGSIGALEVGDLSDIYLPWQIQSKIPLEVPQKVLRYCHLQRPEDFQHELEQALLERGKIKSIYFDCNNWAAVLQKAAEGS